jgi:hypothetical protein
MSASTITTRVQVREGEALAHEIADRRGALDQRRNAFVSERASALQQEMDAHGEARDGTAAELFARCDAVERFAPAVELGGTRASVQQALARGSVEDARAAVAHVEAAAEQVLDQQAQQEVVLERIVEGLSDELEVVGELVHRRDGSLETTVQTAAGGRMPLVAPRMARAGEQLVGWGVGEARIDRLATVDGTVLSGCDARERFVDDACAHLREEQIEIARDWAPVRARKGASPRERHAGA